MHLPFATWLGNLLTVGTPLPMPSRPQGLVLHISDGQYGQGVHSPLPFRRFAHLHERPFADRAGVDVRIAADRRAATRSKKKFHA
jgi:hypothetical protein